MNAAWRSCCLRASWRSRAPASRVASPATTVLAGTSDFASGGAGLPGWARDVRRRVSLEGATSVFVAIDGVLLGALVLDDPIRPETPRVIRSLRRAGVRRTVMVTGDQYGVADMVAEAIGVDAVLAERTPADKVDAVTGERGEAGGVLVMVGDGINDAPALAAADVGVAMGARGATASSEAADIVITVDRLDRLPEAIRIARRSRTIAVQSVAVGMGLSIAAMLAAMTGALAACGRRAPPGGHRCHRDPQRPAGAGRWPGEGAEDPGLDGDRHPAAQRAPRARAVDRAAPRAGRRAGRLAGGLARDELEEIRSFLLTTLVPHEEAEDREVFPLLASGDRRTTTSRPPCTAPTPRSST